MNEIKLKQTFADSIGIPLDQVTDALTYQSISQWDSVAHMALVAAIEGTFNVMLDTDDIIALSSVAKAKEILARHKIDFK